MIANKGEIMSQHVELMILLNTEVWSEEQNETSDYVKCGTLLCQAQLIPPSQECIDECMTKSWVDVTVDGVPFRLFANYVINLMGDTGEVLIPQLLASVVISRPDTKYALSKDGSAWKAYWGVDEPEEGE